MTLAHNWPKTVMSSWHTKPLWSFVRFYQTEINSRYYGLIRTLARGPYKGSWLYPAHLSYLFMEHTPEVSLKTLETTCKLQISLLYLENVQLTFCKLRCVLMKEFESTSVHVEQRRRDPQLIARSKWLNSLGECFPALKICSALKVLLVWLCYL